METLTRIQHKLQQAEYVPDSNRPIHRFFRPLTDVMVLVKPFVGQKRTNDAADVRSDRREGERRVAVRETLLQRSRRQLMERRETGMDKLTSDIGDGAISDERNALSFSIRSLFQ